MYYFATSVMLNLIVNLMLMKILKQVLFVHVENVIHIQMKDYKKNNSLNAGTVRNRND